MNLLSNAVSRLRLFVVLMLCSMATSAQTYELHVTNEQLINQNTYQFDIWLIQTGSTELQLSGIQFGLGLDVSTFNGGTITGSIVAGSCQLNSSQVPTSFSVGTAAQTQVIGGKTYRFFNQAAKAPPGGGNGTIISNTRNGCTSVGTRIGTYRLVNTQPFTANSQMNHVFSTSVGAGRTNTVVSSYTFNTTTQLWVNAAITNAASNLGYQSSGTCLTNIVLNPLATCAVTGSATTTPATCFGGTGSATVTLTGSGSENLPGTYSLDGGPAVPFTTNPFTISGLAAGSYSVVTTTGTCVSDPINFAVTAPATFTATYVKTNKSACAGVPDGSITVTAEGGSGSYNYAWSGAVGSNNPTPAPYPNPGNVAAVTGLEYGFYQVIVSDANGCGSVTLDNIHIQNAYLPYVTYNPSTSATCAPTGSVTGYAQAAVGPYTWQLDGGNSQSSNVFTNVAGGAHTLTATDSRGCSSTINVTVPTAAALGISPYVVNASSCNNDGSIKINRIGGIPPYEYSLDGSPYVTNNLFTGLAAGPHNATIRDSKGCTATMTVTVGQGAGLTVTASKVNTSACVNDGSIQVSASGGVPPYTYTLNGGASQSSNSFANLGEGNYVVKATDSRGCFNTLNVNISINYIVVTYLKQDAPSCSGTGWIKLLRTGGVNPYTYSLDGDNYTANNLFLNLAPGTYTGYVKDAKTCVGSTLTGEIVILPEGCNVGRTVAPVSQEVAANVTAYPNPSVSDFSLRLTGFNMNEKVTVTVTDLFGRKVYQTQGTGKQVYAFGRSFIAGMYTVNIVQGDKQFSVKLVKE